MNLRPDIGSRHGLAALTALIGAIVLLWAWGPSRAFAADPGTVEVYGYQWSKVYKIDLSRLQGSQVTVNGEQVTAYGMLEILQNAEGQQHPAGADFTVRALPEIEIALPGGGKVTYSGSQVRSNTSNLATFYVNDQNVTVMRVPGRGPGGSVAEFEYGGTLNPQLYEPKQSLRSFEVSITPKNQTVKNGAKVTFTATPKNLDGGVKVSYKWAVDGVVRPGSGSTFRHGFTGKSGQSFLVTVIASASGYSDATGATQVLIDKAKKNKPKKNKPKKNESDDPGDDSSTYPGYIPGYNDPYDPGGGLGTGAGSPSGESPSAESPPKKRQRQGQQPVEDGLETVSGELIDPSSTATVIPSTDSPAGSTEEATPADDSGGGGLPGGVKAAFGIGALLGLGGLAEAGAFAGFGRFRSRPWA